MIDWIDVKDRLPVAGDGKKYLVTYQTYYSRALERFICRKEQQFELLEYGVEHGGVNSKWTLSGDEFFATHWAEINSPQEQTLADKPINDSFRTFVKFGSSVPSFEIPEDPVDKELTKEIDEAINKAADSISKSVKTAWKKVFG